MQALYQGEVTGEAPGAAFWQHFEGPPAVQAFARELVDGVVAERGRIDAALRAALEHWHLERLARVDLCVLRLGTYELLARPEIPHAVSIDEALDIVRRFGSADSPAFVNGVLDRVARALGRKDAAERSG